MNAGNAKAVVAVPVYKPELTEYEELSLSRCAQVLGAHPIVFVGPSSLNYKAYLDKIPSASVRKFENMCFTSIEQYSALLLSRAFYERFLDFEFILIHQLDSFVFRDALEEWCRRGYDYVGAPLLNEKGGWLGVGNGGFSLRKTQSCLDVLTSSRKEDPDLYWAMVRQTTLSPGIRAMKYHRKLARQFGWRDDSAAFLKRFIKQGWPEDLFWSLHAVRFHPGFKLAPVETALHFSVEGGLMGIQEIYAAEPPFACHQVRFLKMIQRYLCAGGSAESEYEAVVWRLARSAGIRS